MLSLVWIELSQSKTDWIIVDIPRNVLILGWAGFKLITVINYLVPPDVERSEGDVVGAREVEYLVVAGEGLEEVVGELEDGVGDDVVDDVLLVRVRVGVGHAHGGWGKVTSSGLCIYTGSSSHLRTTLHKSSSQPPDCPTQRPNHAT